MDRRGVPGLGLGVSSEIVPVVEGVESAVVKRENEFPKQLEENRKDRNTETREDKDKSCDTSMSMYRIIDITWTFCSQNRRSSPVQAYLIDATVTNVHRLLVVAVVSVPRTSSSAALEEVIIVQQQQPLYAPYTPASVYNAPYAPLYNRFRFRRQCTHNKWCTDQI